MKGLEMTYQEAEEVLFPFIKDAPCMKEFIISDRTLNSSEFTIKVMEEEENERLSEDDISTDKSHGDDSSEEEGA